MPHRSDGVLQGARPDDGGPRRHVTGLARAYGVLEAGSARAVTAESVFEAASATKVLTTVLALRLARARRARSRSRRQRLPQVVEGPRRPPHRRAAGDVSTAADASEPGSTGRTRASPSTRRTRRLSRDVRGRQGAGDQPGCGGGAGARLGPQATRTSASWWCSSSSRRPPGKPYAQLARELVFAPLGMNASTVTHPLAARVASAMGRAARREGRGARARLDAERGGARRPW